MSSSRVHIARVEADDFDHIDSVVTHTLDQLPSPDWEKSKPVYVKVNALCGSPDGWDTHPQVAVSTAMWFRERGYEVMIGENFGRKALEATGVAQLADRCGIPLHDPLGDLVECPIEGGFLLEKTKISRTVLESHAVSVPKFKTHLESIMSLSLKNMKGCIGGRLEGCEHDERIRYHMIGMHECIADMNKAIRPRLAVVDAIYAMEGIGPGKAMSRLRRLGLVAAGFDPVAVDTVCCRIAGADPADVRHIALAARHGLGTAREDSIEVSGLSIDEARAEDFELPPTDPSKITRLRGVEIVMGKPCSNCISSLASALRILEDKGFEMPPDASVRVVVGPNPAREWDGGQGRLLLGRCLEKEGRREERIGGCPPAASFIVEAIERTGRTAKVCSKV